MLFGMAEAVKCDACNGRGWKIVTRRGHVAASMLGAAQSSREDCLQCDGPSPVAERFEWEVLLPADDGGERLGPCGSTSGQATAMDELRKALRRIGPGQNARGRVVRRVFDFGVSIDDWRRDVIFEAVVDLAGSVRFTRVGS
jgi:hypothetical protein